MHNASHQAVSSFGERHGVAPGGLIAWAQPQREMYASSKDQNGSMWVVLYGGGHCAPSWVVLRYARSCNESAVPSGRIMGGSCRVVSGNVSGCVRGCPTYSLFV